jgi:hypothetical protein
MRGIGEKSQITGFLLDGRIKIVRFLMDATHVAVSVMC